MKFSKNKNYAVKTITFANKFSKAPEVTVNFFKGNTKVDVTDLKLDISSDGFKIKDFEYDETQLNTIPNCFTWCASGDFVDSITDKDTAKDYANLGVNMLVDGSGSVTNEGSFKIYRDDVEIYNLTKNSKKTSLALRVNDKITLPDSASFTAKGIQLQRDPYSLNTYIVSGLNSRFAIVVDKAKEIDLGRTGSVTLADSITFEIQRNGTKFDGNTILENDVLMFKNSDINHNMKIEHSGITFNIDGTDVILDTSLDQLGVIVNAVQDGFKINVIKTQRAKTIDIDSTSTVSVQRGSEIVGTLTHKDTKFEFRSGDILITNKATVTGSDITVTRDSDTWNFTITDLGENYKLQVKNSTGSVTEESGTSTESGTGSQA